MPRTPKGTVKIETDRQWLRLRWSHRGKRYALAVGLVDSEINRRIAQAKADVIRADILAGQFDPSLYRYRDDKVTPLTAVELFQKFIDWKRRQVTKRSLVKYLGLQKLVKQHFKAKQADAITEDQALDFRDWLLDELASTTARERIGMMRSCWSWAIGRKLLTDNPWVNVRVKSSPRQRPQPFTQDEYSQILDGFRQMCPHYVGYVMFVMGVGCRLGEASGLRWGHLSPDCSKIWIGESWGRGERKTTKTNKDRAFELSPTLISMLKTRRPTSVGADDLVFTSAHGEPIDDHNFRRRYWTPVLEAVGVPYRKPYSMRHSFISQAFDQGWSVSEIASITGNSEETILRSYTGGVRGRAKLRSVWSQDEA